MTSNKKYIFERETIKTIRYEIEAETEESAREELESKLALREEPNMVTEDFVREDLIGVEDIESDDMDDDSDEPLVQEGEKVEPSENDNE